MLSIWVGGTGVVTTAKSKVDQVSLVGSTLSPLTLSDSLVVEGDLSPLA